MIYCEQYLDWRACELVLQQQMLQWHKRVSRVGGGGRRFGEK